MEAGRLHARRPDAATQIGRCLWHPMTSCICICTLLLVCTYAPCCLCVHTHLVACVYIRTLLPVCVHTHLVACVCIRTLLLVCAYAYTFMQMTSWYFWSLHMLLMLYTFSACVFVCFATSCAEARRDTSSSVPAAKAAKSGGKPPSTGDKKKEDKKVGQTP